MSGTDMRFNENSSVQEENKMYKNQDQIPQNSNAERTCIWNHRGCLTTLNKPTKSVGCKNNKHVEKEMEEHYSDKNRM